MRYVFLNQFQRAQTFLISAHNIVMDEFSSIYEHNFLPLVKRRKKREEPQRGGRRRQQGREEGKEIKKWDGRKAERKTEEPAD